VAQRTGAKTGLSVTPKCAIWPKFRALCSSILLPVYEWTTSSAFSNAAGARRSLAALGRRPAYIQWDLRYGGVAKKYTLNTGLSAAESPDGDICTKVWSPQGLHGCGVRL